MVDENHVQKDKQTWGRWQKKIASEGEKDVGKKYAESLVTCGTKHPNTSILQSNQEPQHFDAPWESDSSAPQCPRVIKHPDTVVTLTSLSVQHLSDHGNHAAQHLNVSE